ncbi:GGDEF domain-containing protein [Aquabacterium sp.]|uniref:GGDEF domain-containing protein n=1 Tax=Aquabacterium sp. TaxID=1872578 RepID=UPI00248A5C4F|nr:GGDEF domain-containing protein [Aquabacterium sp.]MDI1261002.1 GGDEF domain-containing protein [Aquabacterium sp.]
MADLTPSFSQPHPAKGESALVRAVLGPAGAVRQGVKRLLWMLPAYAFAMTLMVCGVVFQRVQVWQAWALAGYVLCGLSGFYAVLRTGLVAHHPEPTLAFPQVLFSLTTVCLSYAMIESSRGLALEWMCLILVFDMRRLTGRQAQLATFGGLGLLVTMLLFTWRLNPPAADLNAALVTIATVGLTMPTLLIVTKVGRRLHQRRLDQRAAMATAFEQFNALSIRDGLTQLFNRRHMMSLLEDEVRRQQRSRRAFCVAILDIDFFKRVNDQHGHAVGDAVLHDFATLARGTFSGSDAVARWGGEEFLVLMSEADQGQALEMLERLRQAVRQHDWTVHGPGLAVTFSAGVREHTTDDTLAQSLEHADAALYKAKAQGRDRTIASTTAAAVLSGQAT